MSEAPPVTVPSPEDILTGLGTEVEGLRIENSALKNQRNQAMDGAAQLFSLHSLSENKYNASLQTIDAMQKRINELQTELEATKAALAAAVAPPADPPLPLQPQNPANPLLPEAGEEPAM